MNRRTIMRKTRRDNFLINNLIYVIVGILVNFISQWLWLKLSVLLVGCMVLITGRKKIVIIVRMIREKQ